jgi:AcrR family transcriptional regulator
VAVRLISAQGCEASTLRDIAREAGVSPGLLYRYFPSKRAVVLAPYDELSAAFAERASAMEPGPWREPHARTALQRCRRGPATSMLDGVVGGPRSET